MKKSTCKILIGIGVLIVLIGFVPLGVNLSDGNMEDGIAFFVIFCIPAIILFLIAWTKWNSEEEHVNLRRRAKVNVHVEGKMKDLK